MHAVSLLPTLLLVASHESECQGEEGISPQALFAAVFDLAFGSDVGAECARPLGYLARDIVSTVAVEGGLVAYLAALVESRGNVGDVLRNAQLQVPTVVAPALSDGDLAATREALAPRLSPPLSHTGLVPVRNARLAGSAAASFEAATSELEHAGISITILSGYRTHQEQQEIFDAVSPIATNRETFRVGRPGTSMHERGLAVDIAYDGYIQDFRSDSPSETLRSIQRVFREYGWYQFDPFNDVVHFSFGRIG